MNAPTSATRPLDGARIVVTRARQQASGFVERLQQLGANVVVLPAIEIVPVTSREIDEAIMSLARYDWLLFTSVNAVDIFFDRLQELSLTADYVGSIRIGTIGAATAARVEMRGGVVAFVPDAFVAESMIEGLIVREMSGTTVLLPRARIARNTLPDGLREAGATVDVIVVYDTVQPDTVDEAALAQVRSGQIDLLTFASPSTVRNIAELVDPDVRRQLRVACIGPITAAAAREAGFQVDVQAEEFSIDGLIEAIIRDRAGARATKENSHEWA